MTITLSCFLTNYKRFIIHKSLNISHAILKSYLTRILLVFRSYSVRISTRIGFSRLSSVPLRMTGYSSNRPWQLPSKSLPFHHSSIIVPVDALVNLLPVSATGWAQRKIPIRKKRWIRIQRSEEKSNSWSQLSKAVFSILWTGCYYMTDAPEGTKRTEAYWEAGW